MQSDNQIISERRGECRHEHATDVGITIVDMRCICGAEAREPFTMSELYPVPDYSTDPAAWDSAMYEWIEGEGLWVLFLDCLKNIVYNVYTDNVMHSFSREQWRLISSTTDQKAAALAKAIREYK